MVTRVRKGEPGQVSHFEKDLDTGLCGLVSFRDHRSCGRVGGRLVGMGKGVSGHNKPEDQQEKPF